MPPRRKTGESEAAARALLKTFPPELRKDPLASNLIRMSRELDEFVVEGRDRTSHYREIRQTRLALEELRPAESADTATDQARGRRERNLYLVTPDETG